MKSPDLEAGLPSLKIELPRNIGRRLLEEFFCMEILVKRSREGSEEARLEVLESCKPLILSSIRKYHNRGDYDDLIQEGYLLVLEAMEDFDPAYGVYFLGYLKLRLRYYYLNKDGREDYSLHDENSLGLAYINMLASPLNLEEDYLSRLRREALLRKIGSLARREAQVIYLFYFRELSLGEIGSKLGLSYQTVANLKYRGMKKLKKMVKNQDISYLW